MNDCESRLRTYARDLEHNVEFVRSGLDFVRGSLEEMVRPVAEKLVALEGVLRKFYDIFPEIKPETKK